MEMYLDLLDEPFDLGHTLDSGQVFRWELRNGWWTAVMREGVVRVKQQGQSIAFSSSSEGLDAKLLRRYFRLDENLVRIYAEITKDEHVTSAIQRYYGLRLMRQDPWECLVSFVIATNTNIPRIKLMVSNLCSRFGRKIEFESVEYKSFPEPDVLAEASLESLTQCGLGYRARFVKAVAEKVSARQVFLDELSFLDYERAKATLIEEVLGRKTLLGIGRKAADCILLFSAGKDDAFPIDVWMASVLARYYPSLFEERMVQRLQAHVAKKSRLTAKDYDVISGVMRRYFGGHAGYAQQYLFHDARNPGRHTS